VTETVVCIDTDVFVKFLVPEEPPDLQEAATKIVFRAITSGRMVAPAFSWTEVGSVLRRKVRQQQMTASRADDQWSMYCRLQIEFIDSLAVHDRAWEIANQFGLPTLYDASFLACTELARAPSSVTREFWTADQLLVRALGKDRPPYVRLLGRDRL
jgi:predicted nucleic acid-binding protein